MTDLAIRPLTPDLWPELEDLFGPVGACNGCWCMYWRIGSAYTKRPREQNKVAFQRVVKKGPPPGILAFDRERAVGWCQIRPDAIFPDSRAAASLRRWTKSRCGRSRASMCAKACARAA